MVKSPVRICKKSVKSFDFFQVGKLKYLLVGARVQRRKSENSDRKQDWASSAGSNRSSPNRFDLHTQSYIRTWSNGNKSSMCFLRAFVNENMIDLLVAWQVMVPFFSLVMTMYVTRKPVFKPETAVHVHRLTAILGPRRT